MPIHLLRSLQALALAAMTAGAAAQGMPPAPQPEAAPSQKPEAAPAPRADFRVQGFRSAAWGMDIAQVREAVQRDFAPPADAFREMNNPAEGTRALVVRLNDLEPVRGPVLVTYLFEAQGKRLFHVNVNWSTGPTPTEPERAQLAVAGMQLQAAFRRQAWKPQGTAENVREGTNAVLLFAGVDTADAAIEIHLAGVILSDAKGQGAGPSGPTTLHIAYRQHVRGGRR